MNGKEILRLAVAPGESPQIQGNADWMNFEFTPNSSTLGRPVSFKEDPEEWLRSMVAAYAGSELEAQITHDDAAPASGPAAVAAVAPAETPSKRFKGGSLKQQLESLRSNPKMLALIAVLVAAIVAFLLLGNNRSGSAPTSSPAPNAPAQTGPAATKSTPAPRSKMPADIYQTARAMNKITDGPQPSTASQAAAATARCKELRPASAKIDNSEAIVALRGACAEAVAVMSSSSTLGKCGSGARALTCLDQKLGQISAHATATASKLQDVRRLSGVTSGDCQTYLAAHEDALAQIVAHINAMRTALAARDEKRISTEANALQALTKQTPGAADQFRACKP